MKPLVKTFFDRGTSTFSYIVHSGKESSCAIIDPVQNFNSNNARTDSVSYTHLTLPTNREL